MAIVRLLNLSGRRVEVVRILILDDDTDRANGWREDIVEINSDFSVDVPDVSGVVDVIADLHNSRLFSRKPNHEYKSCERFAGYDLVIIDYDLLGLDGDARSAWSTGAEVAYAARLMSDAGPIVVVNQYGTNSFDLTMRRTISSYADFDLGDKQVTSAGLWKSRGFEGFRPWHWPNLLNEAVRFNRMQAFVLENLENPVMDVLGFSLDDPGSHRFIGHDVAGYLGIKAGESLTFKELIVERRAAQLFNILEKDVEVIEKMPREQQARLASVVVWHWLEKVVLPSQEVLCDIPHLASRFPWVVRGASDGAAWQRLCDLEGSVGVVDELEAYRFEHDFLFSRPVYWGEGVKSQFGVPVGFDISSVPDLVFCEDCSGFLPMEEAKSFPADLLCFDKERWVKGIWDCDGHQVNYEPQAYLLM